MPSEATFVTSIRFGPCGLIAETVRLPNRTIEWGAVDPHGGPTVRS